jgi:hypothetical protein
VATARQIINPNNVGSIKFATSEAGLDAAVEQGFQITSFKVAPKPNLNSAPGTFGAPPVDVPGQTSFNLVVSYLQDWGLDANAFAEFLHNHDGEEYWFRIDPADAGVKGMDGKCFIVAGGYGGDAGSNWVETVTFPCSTKPTILAAT